MSAEGFDDRTGAGFDEPGPARPERPGGVQLPGGLLAAAEAAVNGALALDPEGARGFASVYGRIIAVELTGLGTRFTLIPGPDRIQIFGPYDAEPDCLIRGTPVALLRLTLAERKDAELGGAGVQVEGDSTVAHDLAKAMAGLDVDWEEQLAKLVGDPIAHQLGQGVRSAQAWGRRTSESLGADLRDYLQEEGRLLPTRYEVEAFLADVDTLRDDLERLAARVARLARTLAEDTGGGSDAAPEGPSGSAAAPQTAPEREPRSQGAARAAAGADAADLEPAERPPAAGPELVPEPEPPAPGEPAPTPQAQPAASGVEPPPAKPAADSKPTARKAPAPKTAAKSSTVSRPVGPKPDGTRGPRGPGRGTP